MGVLDCCRIGCDSIMCDTHISSIGYLCDECQKEFKYYLVEIDHYPQDDVEIIEALHDFIEYEKHHFDEHELFGALDIFFKNHIRK